MRLPVEIGSLIEMRDGLSDLSQIDFALYEGTGPLLIPYKGEDPLKRIFTSSEERKVEYELFIKNSLERAAIRKGVSLFKGPLNEYHCFIPAQIGEASLVLVGKAFYISEGDLDDFLLSKASRYAFSPDDLVLLRKSATMGDIRKVSGLCETVSRLFSLAVKDNYEKTITREKYKRIRTVFDFLFEMKEDMDEQKIYSLLSDMVLFIFHGETVSVMAPSGVIFKPLLVTGALKESVKAITPKVDTSLVSDAVRNQKPLVFTETIELLKLGYPEEITSFSLFPIFKGEEIFGLLGIFNTYFENDEKDIIFKLCNLTGFVLKTIFSQKLYGRHIDDLTAMNLAVMNLGTEFEDPETLYESIVKISSKIVNAEKASLMLPEDERNELLIKAVKGINKWIAKNIRIKIGEGIAGRVYKEGRPLWVSDIEKNLSAKNRPNYRTGSFASIPLKIGDETIGVLNLADKTTGEVFSETDIAFLRYFASYASIAIRGSQYYRISEEMRTLSITDSLTGLFNRRYFDDRLFEELQRAIRYDSLFSLAIFDIDDFKLFNDTEGHLAGDEVLKAISNISRESLRSIDIIARFGGEEFSVIMPQTDKEEAFLVAERVRRNIQELMPVSWKNFPRDRITVSIGIAMFPEDGKDAETLMRTADKALYKAKVGGKDRTVVWEAPDLADERTPLHGIT